MIQVDGFPGKKAPESFSFDQVRSALKEGGSSIPAGVTSSEVSVDEAVALEIVNKYRGDWK